MNIEGMRDELRLCILLLRLISLFFGDGHLIRWIYARNAYTYLRYVFILCCHSNVSCINSFPFLVRRLSQFNNQSSQFFFFVLIVPSIDFKFISGLYI